jgi:hypothetical protein
MLEKIKKLAGMERVVFETLVMMIFVSAAHLVTYWISGSALIAIGAAATGAFAAAVLAAAIGIATVVGVFAVIGAIAFAAADLPFAAIFFIFAAAAFVILVAHAYKVGCWKVLFLFIAEGGLLFVAFMVFIPYLAIVLLTAALIALGVILLRKRSATV